MTAGLDANDTISSLAAGGLIPVRSTAVRIISEDLRISERRVEITYKFANETDDPVDAIVAFPLPMLDGGLIYNHSTGIPTRDPRNFVAFEVRQDGKPIPVKMQVRAWKEDQEITARLRQLGLPVSVLDKHAFDAAVTKLSPAVRKKLEDEALIVSEGNDYTWPFWDTDIQFYWRQVFPARKTIELRQTYRPVVGGFYWTPIAGEEPSEAKEYCPTPAAIQGLRQWRGTKLPDGEVLAWGRQIDYVLTTGANWKGPISRFHLTVETGNPDDILSSCIRLQQTAATRYETVIRDFVPRDDLHLLILTQHKPPD